jgi:hypothetical protein
MLVEQKDTEQILTLDLVETYTKVTMVHYHTVKYLKIIGEMLQELTIIKTAGK